MSAKIRKVAEILILHLLLALLIIQATQGKHQRTTVTRTKVGCGMAGVR